MKINRESARVIKESARRMIGNCKAFVLVTIDKKDRIGTTREIRGLAKYDAQDPLREEFLKMCNNLQTGQFIVNEKHIRYVDIKEQSKKVEEAKAKRSEELNAVV